jgi:cysteine-rich repeat protein
MGRSARFRSPQPTTREGATTMLDPLLRTVLAAGFLTVLLEWAIAEGAPLSVKLKVANPTGRLTQRSVALGDGKIVIGYLGNATPPFPGAVAVFDEESAELLRTIVNPTGDHIDDFGFSLAIKDGRIAVGASQHETTEGVGTAGAVHIFDAESGALLRTLMSPDPPDTYDGFGRALAWVGGALAVGEPQIYPPFFFDGGPGRVHVFDPGTGALLRTIDDPGGTCCGFGLTLAPFGSDLLVGAATQTIAGFERAGQVYRIDPATGALLQTYVNPDPDEHDWFGLAISALGSDVLVGAPFESSLGVTWHGRAYLYDGTTGALERTFDPPALEGAELGDAVAEIGGYAALGTFYYHHVYLVDVSTGALVQHLQPSEPSPYGNLGFGSMLAADGGRLLVGSAGLMIGKAGGGAYLFDLCGNGSQAPLEHCDDGNTSAGDGCSAECRFEACAASPAGTCRAPDPSRSAVKLKHGSSPARDDFRWSWKSSSGTTLADLGDPQATDAYQLCVYDQSALPQPRMNLGVRAAGDCDGTPCWTAAASTGFRYRHKRRTPSGVDQLLMRSAASGKTRFKTKGKGEHLALATTPLAGTVTVELHKIAASPVCWQATYTTPRRNDPLQYRATSD